jgi:hypothetical protein
MSSTTPAHVYEVRPRKDKRGVDLISDVLPFGRLWNCARIIFDCPMVNDAATIKGEHK